MKNKARLKLREEHIRHAFTESWTTFIQAVVNAFEFDDPQGLSSPLGFQRPDGTGRDRMALVQKCRPKSNDQLLYYWTPGYQQPDQNPRNKDEIGI